MAVGGVDDDEVHLGIDQALGAGDAGVADAGRGGDAQAAVIVLGGIGVEPALLDVLDRDQPDAAVVVVDDQELLDAVLVEEALGLDRVDRVADRDQIVAGHQFGDRLRRIGGEADVAVGEDAEEPARRGTVGDHRDAGYAVAAHELERVGERRLRTDGDRVHDHARFELLHLADGFRLLVGREVAVDDADAAGLRHGDGEPGFGDGIHGRRDDRQVERDRAGEPGADIGVGREHRGVAGREQHVVEGEGLAAGRSFQDDGHRQLPG